MNEITSALLSAATCLFIIVAPLYILGTRELRSRDNHPTNHKPRKETTK